jgi:hypothetical protein
MRRSEKKRMEWRGEENCRRREKGLGSGRVKRGIVRKGGRKRKIDDLKERRDECGRESL